MKIYKKKNTIFLIEKKLMKMEENEKDQFQLLEEMINIVKHYWINIL